MSTLTELVERMTRPGLLGLAGKTMEKRCRQELETYFRHLSREILGLNLENVVEHVTKETALHAVQLKLHNTLRHRQPVLKAILEVNLADAMLKGDRVHHFAEATQPTPPDSIIPPADSGDLGSEEIDQLGLSGQAAADWAEQNAARLVTGIDETTVNLLSSAISTGIEEQMGVDGTGRLIRQVLDDMSVSRARTIAITEMNGAFSEAALQKMLRLGIEYKRWILSPDACPICQDNADQGAIAVGEDFDSGDERPPAHPNCRCAVVGARSPDEEAA
jgi:SPP1 gp7 family putative phage head morphogenesis protein